MHNSNLNSHSKNFHSHSVLTSSPEERFQDIDLAIDVFGYRPLAREAKLSAGHVHRVLNGKIKEPMLGTLRKIADVLQLPVEDLLFYVECQMKYEQKRKAA